MAVELTGPISSQPIISHGDLPPRAYPVFLLAADAYPGSGMPRAIPDRHRNCVPVAPSARCIGESLTDFECRSVVDVCSHTEPKLSFATRLRRRTLLEKVPAVLPASLRQMHCV